MKNTLKILMDGGQSHIFKPVHFSTFSKFTMLSKDVRIYSYSNPAIIHMRDSAARKT